MRLILIAHRILIGAAVCFGIFYTVWEYRAYRESGELPHAFIAVVAAVLTLALAYYLKNLKRYVK
jgi:hypothetical protein